MLETGQVSPILYKKNSSYAMFDEKMHFTRKARWVLDGHRNLSPEGYTCTGVVSRESFGIYFIHAVIEDTDVWACDI